MEGTTRTGDRDIPYKLGPTKSNDLYTRGKSIKTFELTLPKYSPPLKGGLNKPMAVNRGFFPQGFFPKVFIVYFIYIMFTSAYRLFCLFQDQGFL